MHKILTAKEFRISQCVTILQDLSNQDWEELMIDFAKLHVKAALEAAATKAKISTEYYHEDDVGRTKLREILESSDLASERTDGDGIMYAVDTYEINKQSILNSYPESNIK